MDGVGEFVRNNSEIMNATQRMLQVLPFLVCNNESLVQVQGAMVFGRLVGLLNDLCIDPTNTTALRIQRLNQNLALLRGGAVMTAAQAHVYRNTRSAEETKKEEDVAHHSPAFYRAIAAMDPDARELILTHQRTIAADVALQVLDVVDVFLELLVRSPPQVISRLLSFGCSDRTCAGWSAVLSIAAVRSGLRLYINRQEMRSVTISASAHLGMLYRAIRRTVSRLMSSSSSSSRKGRVEANADANGGNSDSQPSSLVPNRVASPGLVIPGVRVPIRSSISSRHASRSVRQPSAALAADDSDYRSSSVLGRQQQQQEQASAVVATLNASEANGSPSPVRPGAVGGDEHPASPSPRAVVSSSIANKQLIVHANNLRPGDSPDVSLPPGVHLRSFVEYCAFLLDLIGYVSPMLWAGIAYLHRPAGLLGAGVSPLEAKNRRSASKAAPSTFGGWLLNMSRSILPRSSKGVAAATKVSTSVRIHQHSPSPAVRGSLQQSWGAWRIMMLINVLRVVGSFIVRAMRTPTVVVQDGPPSLERSPHHLADTERAGSALRAVTGHCLRDPYFSVVLRSFISDYLVNGRFSRIPLLGSIVSAQVAFYLALQRGSFTYTNK